MPTRTSNGVEFSTGDMYAIGDYVGMFDAVAVWVLASATVTGAAIAIVSDVNRLEILTMVVLPALTTLYFLQRWGTTPTVDEAKRDRMAEKVTAFLDDVGIDQTEATVTDEQGRTYRVEIAKRDGEWMVRKLEAADE